MTHHRLDSGPLAEIQSVSTKVNDGPKSELELLWICSVAEVILCNSLGIFPCLLVKTKDD